MSLVTPRLPYTRNVPVRLPEARVWRPFSREVADIVAVESRGRDLRPRMYPWFGISLLRSPAVVTVESRLDVRADRHSVVLIPSFQLHELRALGEPDEGAITLLFRGRDLEICGIPTHSALVADPALGEQMAALISRLLHSAVLVEHASNTRSLLEQLLAFSSPLAGHGARRASPLAPVRAYLKTNVHEAVSTEAIARIGRLSESQLIRTFHYDFGLPPHAYHLRVRLAAACELLSRGVAVARVSNECGFADQSHLSRRFKSVYGVTPAAWAAGSASIPAHPASVPAARLTRGQALSC